MLPCNAAAPVCRRRRATPTSSTPPKPADPSLDRASLQLTPPTDTASQPANYSRSMPAPAHQNPDSNTGLWLIAILASVVLVILALVLPASSSPALVAVAFAVAFVVTAAGSLIQSTRPGTAHSDSGRPTCAVSEPDSLNLPTVTNTADAPIRSISEDRLDRAPFAKSITERIHTSRTGPSVVFGLAGPWGGGKSSVLEMIKEILNDGQHQKEWTVVTFTPWSATAPPR